MVSLAELNELARQARVSPRGRSHLILHASHEDPVQRYFVCADRRSYFRPHRHASEGELALVIRGSFDLLLFDDLGIVLSRNVIGGGTYVTYEVAPATWHTLVAREDGSTFLEIKQGPYDPANAASYAEWAPAEGDPAVPAFLSWLAAAAPGDRPG